MINIKGHGSHAHSPSIRSAIQCYQVQNEQHKETDTRFQCFSKSHFQSTNNNKKKTDIVHLINNYILGDRCVSAVNMYII